jgi:asparagine synthase (glutamine-hydrolysing)
MCGIAGSYNFSNKKVLTSMLDRIKHRGPDDSGQYLNSTSMIGINRLAILDIRNGKQPMFSDNKKISLVFNGEIFNYIEIKKELEKNGIRFFTKNSDTEVILKAYEYYGLDCFNKFNGMFAIAIIDENKKNLILSRDRTGIKPLFYTQIENKFFFASEIKSLFEVPNIRKEPDYNSISIYFSLKNIPRPFTGFKNIFQVNPSEFIIINKNNLVKKNFYEKKNYPINSFSLIKNSHKLYNLLSKSIEIRMRSDVEVGAFLSGGLDSSIICFLASQYTKKRMKTFTLTYLDYFEEKNNDKIFAKKMSKILNTEHYELEIRKKEINSKILSAIDSFDQPFAGVISSYFLSKLTSKYVKTCLSGDGADELFGSYKFPRLVSEFNRNLNNIELISAKDLSLNINSTNREIFLQKKYSVKNYLNFYLNKISSQIKCKDSINKSLIMDYRTLLCDQVLSYADMHSMQHSLEVRPPFLDNDLIEFAFQIPGKQKINKNINKFILKKTFAKYLPKEIIYRKKEGFVMPLEEIFIKNNQKLICNILSLKNLENHNLLKYRKINHLLKNIDSNNFINNNKIWIFYCFQNWWNKNFI